MLIKTFAAKNYRNIEDASLAFSPGINLLYGQNAQGKTNVLEGIYTFARGKSFRGASDGEQVRFGERGFSISLGFFDGTRDQTLSYRYGRGVRERTRNGAPLSSLREMMGIFRAVLFTPEHLSLVKGGPSERRLFANVGISQLRPSYLGLVSRYNTILEQRNSLLKCAQKGEAVDMAMFEVWNRSLAEAAADIALLRASYLRAVGDEAAKCMEDISAGKEKLTIFYEGNFEITNLPETDRPLDILLAVRAEERNSIISRYEELFSSRVEREIAAGHSLFGIQHDDICIKINEKDARNFASQGQQRSVALALKLAEGEISRKESGEYPVFLFDDVLSELDGARREYLLASVRDRQVILTACESYGIEHISANIISVEDGRYDPAHR